jgi:hypothetical protein
MTGLSVAMTAPAFEPRSVPHLVREPPPVLPDGRLGRLDQQLAAGVAAEVPAEEVKALGEVDDPRLVLVQGQAPHGQPSRQPFPDAFGLLPGMTADREIIGVSHRDRGVLAHPGGVGTRLVAHSGGLLKAMQRDIQEQRGNDAALCAVLAYAQCRPIMAGESRIDEWALRIGRLMRS